jgi:hypothetical protein
MYSGGIVRTSHNKKKCDLADTLFEMLELEVFLSDVKE